MFKVQIQLWFVESFFFVCEMIFDVSIKKFSLLSLGLGTPYLYPMQRCNIDLSITLESLDIL